MRELLSLVEVGFKMMRLLSVELNSYRCFVGMCVVKQRNINLHWVQRAQSFAPPPGPPLTCSATVKKSARSDRRAFIEDLAERAEQAAIRDEMTTVDNITKKLGGKYTPGAPCQRRGR